MTDLALVHLVWGPAGIDPLRRFLRAYAAHAAGADHELVILFNGFDGGGMEPQREALRQVAHTEAEVPLRVQDLEAYLWIAQRLTHRYVCFVNSYSEPLADGWLGMLDAVMRARHAGAVAATGSWESMYTNYALAIASRAQTAAGTAKQLLRRYRLARYRRDFDPMPNPHLRSNAFAVERATWVEVSAGRIARKQDAWRFESGRQSFTRRIERKGLDVFVVGRDGRAYGKADWARSRTFRSGGQSNLLVADNRTRQYAEADDAEKRRLNTLAWGAGTAPL